MIDVDLNRQFIMRAVRKSDEYFYVHWTCSKMRFSSTVLSKSNYLGCLPSPHKIPYPYSRQIVDSRELIKN